MSGINAVLFYGAAVQGRGDFSGGVNPNGVDLRVTNGIGDAWTIAIEARSVVDLMATANALDAITRQIDARVAVLREVGEGGAT